MRPETTVVLLFSVATAVAIAVRYIRFPYTVALVLVGLALGAMHLVPAPHLTKALLFAVILPGLLFEASFNINAKEFWASRLTIGALAVPGVVAAIALTALLVTGMMTGFALDVEFNWRHARQHERDQRRRQVIRQADGGRASRTPRTATAAREETQ